MREDVMWCLLSLAETLLNNVMCSLIGWVITQPEIRSCLPFTRDPICALCLAWCAGISEWNALTLDPPDPWLEHTMFLANHMASSDNLFVLMAFTTMFERTNVPLGNHYPVPNYAVGYCHSPCFLSFHLFVCLSVLTTQYFSKWPIK